MRLEPARKNTRNVSRRRDHTGLLSLSVGAAEAFNPRKWFTDGKSWAVRLSPDEVAQLR